MTCAPSVDRFLFLVGGDMIRYKPPERAEGEGKEVGRGGAASDSTSDSDSDSPAPRPAPALVFGPVLPPPKRRNGPEWRLFRALVRADVRGVIDVHVRNFLLLAWRERETRLNGRFTIDMCLPPPPPRPPAPHRWRLPSASPLLFHRVTTPLHPLRPPIATPNRRRPLRWGCLRVRCGAGPWGRVWSPPPPQPPPPRGPPPR